MNILDFVKNLRDKIRPSHRKADAILSQERPQDFMGDVQKEFAGGIYDLIQENDHVKFSEAAANSWNAFLFDPRVRSAVIKISEKTAYKPDGVRPFKVRVTKFGERLPRIEKHIDNLFLRLGIYSRVDQFIRKALLDGSAYYRVFLDDSLQVAGLKKISLKNNRMLIKLPEDFEESQFANGYVLIDKVTQRPINVFYWWEVIPFHWNYDEDMGCGIPLVGLYKKHVERLDKSERSIAIARWTRSFRRLAFKIKAETPEQFEQFVRIHEEMRKNHGDEEIFSDVYATDDVKTLDESSAALWNIDDIEHLQKSLVDGLGVPRPLYGSGGKEVPNRAVLDVIYNEWLQSQIQNAHQTVTGEHFYSGVLAVITLDFLLNGRHPDFTRPFVVWPNKHILGDVELQAINDAYDRGMLSKETYLNLSLKVDWEEEKKKLEEDRVQVRIPTNGKTSQEPVEV